MKNLQQKVMQTVGKFLVLTDNAKNAQAEVARISQEIAELDRLLARKDDVLKALNEAQTRAQAKNKGVYEGLLTDLIKEVMPHNASKVVLTTGMKNNKASLDFDIEVDDGELENIAEDQGGSISNITAMAIRFIVLARHPNRRVLLLDESDCHLREEYIPAFAAVISQMAIKLGIQVLFISHHPASHFMGYGRVIELHREGRITHSRILSEEGPLPEGYEPPSTAFRYVRLQNFGRLQNALIELSPGLNIITGDNNLGKSKLMQAIAELSTFDAKTRRITHKRPFFEVEVGLEEGMSLNWHYDRSGKDKTTIILKDAQGAEIKKSKDGTKQPEWLQTYLAMPLVNGQNIHYHSQKLPNYLLGAEFSSTDRAQMLPLGRESRDVLQMNQEFNARVNAARQDRIRLAKELLNHQNRLAVMSVILDKNFDGDDMFARCKHLEESQRELQERESFINELERLQTLAAFYEEGISACKQEPIIEVELTGTAARESRIDELERLQTLEVIYREAGEKIERQVLVDVELMANPQMADDIRQLENLQARKKALLPILDVKPFAPLPELHDLASIIESGRELKKLRAQVEALSKIKDVIPLTPIEIKDHSEIESLITGVETLQARLTKGNTLISANKTLQEELDLEYAQVIKELGGICPTCDQPFGVHQHD
jgi:ABC-type iron transport system FetAB ATPase subunit